MRKFGLGLILCLLTWGASAATLLPNGRQVFDDANGQPLVGGFVYFYIPNTTTTKQTWKDPLQTQLNQNPVILDVLGSAVIYGSGAYRQIVQDSSGNTIWDQLTADTSAVQNSWSSGGISGGSPNSQTLTITNFSPGTAALISYIAGFTNTGSLTLSINGGTPILVVQDTQNGPASLTANSVVAGNSVTVYYDPIGGVFHLVYPSVFPPLWGGSTASVVANPVTDLCLNAVPAWLTVSQNGLGSQTITSFGTSCVQGQMKIIEFSGVNTITQSSSIVTPGGLNITTSSGDFAIMLYLGSGNWQVVHYINSAGARLGDGIVPPQGRLTLITGTPVLITTTTGATSVKYTPYKGTQLPLWNGSSFQNTYFTELSQALNDVTVSPLAAAANTLYDYFICKINGTLVLSRGPAWSNLTTRSMGLTRVNGIYVNASAYTNGCPINSGTWIGTVATDPGAATVSFNPIPGVGSGGPAGGAWNGIWNYYNRLPLTISELDNKASWTYASTTWRQVDGSTNNRLTFVVGLPEDGFGVIYQNVTSASSGANTPYIGIAINSTTTPAIASSSAAGGSSAVIASGSVRLEAQPVFGENFVAAMEAAAGASVTFSGTANAVPSMQLSAQIMF